MAVDLLIAYDQKSFSSSLSGISKQTNPITTINIDYTTSVMIMGNPNGFPTM